MESMSFLPFKGRFIGGSSSGAERFIKEIGIEFLILRFIEIEKNTHVEAKMARGNISFPTRRISCTPCVLIKTLHPLTDQEGQDGESVK
jgi:hypothetical protein